MNINQRFVNMIYLIVRVCYFNLSISSPHKAISYEDRQSQDRKDCHLWNQQFVYTFIFYD